MSESPVDKNWTSFVGDVLKLVSGTAFAQVLNIIAAPFLTRLYGPEAFGLSAIFVGISTIISGIACLRYELSIMLPETDKEAANLLGGSLGLVVIISLLTCPLMWLGKAVIVNFLQAPEIGLYLWLMPLAVFFSGVFLALNYWNSRTKRFGRLSVANAFRSIATKGSQLGVGYAGYTTGGSLIGSNLVGSALATLVLGSQIWRDDRALLLKSISRRSMIAGLKRYYKFPLYNTWAGLLNSISWQLPTFMLSSFFSSTIVGYYALGNTIIRLPMNLIGGSIAQVFFQRAAEAKKRGEISSFVKSVFERLVTYGLFPMLLISFIGKDLFVTIFGENWSQAGVYSQILSLYMFFNFIAAPLGQLFSVLEKQEVAMITNVILFFVPPWFPMAWRVYRKRDLYSHSV